MPHPKAKADQEFDSNEAITALATIDYERYDEERSSEGQFRTILQTLKPKKN
jgi:hypothetical protein